MPPTHGHPHTATPTLVTRGPRPRMTVTPRRMFLGLPPSSKQPQALRSMDSFPLPRPSNKLGQEGNAPPEPPCQGGTAGCTGFSSKISRLAGSKDSPLSPMAGREGVSLEYGVGSRAHWKPACGSHWDPGPTGAQHSGHNLPTERR